MDEVNGMSGMYGWSGWGEKNEWNKYVYIVSAICYGPTCIIIRKINKF